MRALAVHRRVAVASANSCGKSWLAARLVCWWLTNYQPSIAVTTAPTDRQVRRILWKEIHRATAAATKAGHSLGGKLLTKAWEFDEDHWAIGFAIRDYDPDAFQGIHGDHVLVVADEAAGITGPVYDGIVSILKGQHPRLLAIGNPTALSGWFYEAFRKRGWWTTHISAFETPNLEGRGIVIPGLVTAQDVEDAREDWGEGSYLWQARILGQFPGRVEDTLIALSWVEAAGNEEPAREGLVEVGADVARYGSDSTVFIARQGGNAFTGEEHNQQDTMETAGRLVQFARRVGASRIKVDAVGLGAGVADRCREVLNGEIEVIDLGAGEKATNSRDYADAGTEWWATLAKELQAGTVGGAVFQERRVLADLSGRRYKYQSNGQMKLESKEDIKRRGGRSPDWGDAVAMAFTESWVGQVGSARDLQSVGTSYAKEASNW